MHLDDVEAEKTSRLSNSICSINRYDQEPLNILQHTSTSCPFLLRPSRIIIQVSSLDQRDDLNVAKTPARLPKEK